MTVFIYYGKMWRKYLKFAISANIGQSCARSYVNFWEKGQFFLIKIFFRNSSTYMLPSLAFYICANKH
jgi:hypothetical protein